MNEPESDSKQRPLPQADLHDPPKTDLTFDVEGIDQILKQTIPSTTFSGHSDTLMGAIAEGMHRAEEKLQTIEAALTALGARVERLEVQVRQDTRAAVVEVAALRDDVLSERKALSALSVFNAVISSLDSLQALRTLLAENTESPTYRQVVALIDSLTMALRGLGFVEFQVTVGDQFDPTCMECVGYAEGQVGIVLGVNRTGYRTQAGVVRPVGVLIADPNSSV